MAHHHVRFPSLVGGSSSVKGGGGAGANSTSAPGPPRPSTPHPSHAILPRPARATPLSPPALAADGEAGGGGDGGW